MTSCLLVRKGQVAYFFFFFFFFSLPLLIFLDGDREGDFFDAEEDLGHDFPLDPRSLFVLGEPLLLGDDGRDGDFAFPDLDNGDLDLDLPFPFPANLPFDFGEGDGLREVICVSSLAWVVFILRVLRPAPSMGLVVSGRVPLVSVFFASGCGEADLLRGNFLPRPGL